MEARAGSRRVPRLNRKLTRTSTTPRQRRHNDSTSRQHGQTEISMPPSITDVRPWRQLRNRDSSREREWCAREDRHLSAEQSQPRRGNQDPPTSARQSQRGRMRRSLKRNMRTKLRSLMKRNLRLSMQRSQRKLVKLSLLWNMQQNQRRLTKLSRYPSMRQSRQRLRNLQRSTPRNRPRLMKPSRQRSMQRKWPRLTSPSQQRHMRLSPHLSMSRSRWPNTRRNRRHSMRVLRARRRNHRNASVANNRKRLSNQAIAAWIESFFYINKPLLNLLCNSSACGC